MIIKPYAPQADSLAAKVISFLVFNEGEETLTVDDIVEKFDCARKTIHTVLAPARDAELVERERTEDGDYLYKIGPALREKRDQEAYKLPYKLQAKPSIEPKEKKSCAPKMIDFDKLVVENDVPYTPNGNKGESKWDGLFLKLKKKGQSVVIPGRIKPALAAAITKHNRKGGTTFRAAMTSKTEARVWRLS